MTQTEPFISQFRKDQYPQEQIHSYIYSCVKCGTGYSDWTVLKNEKPQFLRTLCDGCDEEDHQSRKLARDCVLDQDRRNYFAKMCPEIYRESDFDLLPAAQLRMMMAYNLSERGLLIIGDSRKGKTRCAWLLMQKLVMLGYRVEALTEVEYSLRVKSFKTSEGFRNYLCNIQMLFLDDLGHVAAGQKHLEELYHIVEYRTSHKKPIVCTTQFSGAELDERSGRNKTMSAIINRLREFCDIIDFNK